MTENIEAGNREPNQDEAGTLSALPKWAQRILALVKELELETRRRSEMATWKQNQKVGSQMPLTERSGADSECEPSDT